MSVHPGAAARAAPAASASPAAPAAHAASAGADQPSDAILRDAKPPAAPRNRWRREWKAAVAIVAVFVLCFYLPVEWLQASNRLRNAAWESLFLVRWYAREHIILCLIPAFFIAGAIAVFISRASVIKYVGPAANKALAYGVASVAGTILAVCSCTVLPLFAGIYGRGAGLGPASAFLYAGPAINVLAIIFTARVLGLQLGIARAVGAVLFSIVIGLSMHFLFRGEESEKRRRQSQLPELEVERPLWQNALFLTALVSVLVFANWGEPSDGSGLFQAIHDAKWVITVISALALALILVRWFDLEAWKVATLVVATTAIALVVPGRPLIPFAAAVVGLALITSSRSGPAGDWFAESWHFAKQILPLLLVGVLIAGAMLGRPGHEGLIPSHWVSDSVGGNSLLANFFASIAGAVMYFATLTEVPILQGLFGSGMGEGPALALLLAGPALSLPNMLVIRSVIGGEKTTAYVALVVVMSTLAGVVYGAIA